MRNEIPHTAYPFYHWFQRNIQVIRLFLPFLPGKAQTSPFLSIWRFEPSKFMRSSLTQTDVFLFSHFESFDAVS